MQLPFGKFEFTFVRIFLIHGQTFIPADVEGFVTGIGRIDRRGNVHFADLFVVDEEFDGRGAVQFLLFHGMFQCDFNITVRYFHFTVEIVPVQAKGGIAVSQFSVFDKQGLPADAPVDIAVDVAKPTQRLLTATVATLAASIAASEVRGCAVLLVTWPEREAAAILQRDDADDGSVVLRPMLEASAARFGEKISWMDRV